MLRSMNRAIYNCKTYLLLLGWLLILSMAGGCTTHIKNVELNPMDDEMAVRMKGIIYRTAYFGKVSFTPSFGKVTDGYRLYVVVQMPTGEPIDTQLGDIRLWIGFKNHKTRLPLKIDHSSNSPFLMYHSNAGIYTATIWSYVDDELYPVDEMNKVVIWYRGNIQECVKVQISD